MVLIYGKLRWGIILSLALLLSACSPWGGGRLYLDDTLYQVGTIDSLLAGRYDGFMDVGALTRYGDLGIGTFHALDGEMIVLDGTVYQARSDGTIAEPAAEMQTPFASVAPFRPIHDISIRRGMGFEDFKAFIDSRAPQFNQPVAIRLTGTFERVHTRSVPPQSKPYPPLAEVAETQPEFERETVNGTLVGFRLPVYMDKLNVTGYHLHFLSEDHTFGGHVLDFDLLNGRAEVALLDNIYLSLPVGQEGFQSVRFDQDRSGELEAVEK